MLPWADEKYPSARWLAQDAIFGYRYPTLEISGGISSESGSPQIASVPRTALEAFWGVSQPALGNGQEHGAVFPQQNGDDLFFQDQV